MRWVVGQVMLCVVLISMGSGCGAIGTKEPIYDPAKDLAHDDRLVGKWVWVGAMGLPEGGLEIRRQDKSYVLRTGDMQTSSPDEPHNWAVDLVPLGRNRYLFFRSDSRGTQLLPAYRVEFADHGNQLHLSLLNTFYIGHFLQAHPGKLSYEEAPGFFERRAPASQPATEPTTQSAKLTIQPSSEPSTQPTPANIILTDSPAKIRQFLIRHQDDAHWFFKPWILYRTTNPTSLW